MEKLKENTISIIYGVISVSFLIILWEVAAKIGWNYSNIFPPPSRFISEIIESDFKIGLGSQAASVQASIFASVYRVIVGLVIGFISALFCGFIISSNKWAKRFLLPIIRLMSPIAPIAWIPLALVLFGIGNQTAIFIVFMGVFFMLTIATVRAVEIVPKNLINSGRTLGARKSQIWRFIILPQILPSVFTILRLNFIAAWMAVLAAEMTGLRDGLGAIIMTGRNLFNNEMILAGMFLIGVTGFLFDIFLKYIQDKFFWWDDK